MIFFAKFSLSTAFLAWQPKIARHTPGDKLVCLFETCNTTLSSIPEKLSAFGFVRIHRSVVVNVAHIEGLRRCVTCVYLVRVSGCKRYTITRTYKDNLRFLADVWLGTEI
jgi:hypothetical protein